MDYKLCLSIILFLTLDEVICVIVHEVNVGDDAILPCPSNNDNNHRFQYWELKDDKIIGPWNNHNHNHKYRYEVWSGRLIIKSTSTAEAGFYKCISKHVKGEDLNIEAVELIVKRDWEDAFEHDPQTNTYRAVIGVLVILMMFLIGGIACIVKRRRSQNIIDMTRDESPEEVNYRRSTQRPYNTTNQPSTSSRRNDRVLDNAVVETDLKSSFSLPDFD